MSRKSALGRSLALLLVTFAAATAAQSGCGSQEPLSGFDSGDRTGTEGGPIAPPIGTFDPTGEGGAGRDADPDALGAFVLSPPTATIQVTIVDGIVTTNAPAAFTATYSGQRVSPTWLFDRGELGEVSPAGVFTANGRNVGEGTLTARFGAREATAKVKVVVAAQSNGAPSGDAGAGSGGLGGVGGEPLGPAVAAGIVTKLKTQSNLPATPAELGFLYPYDKTVWPRGLLAPLLMWQSTREAAAIYVKMSQGNYAFEGTYLVAGQAAGSDARKRVRLEDMAWKTATSGNQGDDLTVEVKIYSAIEDKVYGPIRQTYRVAQGVLRGTVYYNSYDSRLTGGAGAATGGVIAIKPRSPDPVLAVPGAAGKCHVCHTVSADGSTLWAQDGKLVYPGGVDDYRRGAAYDLKSASSYTSRTVYDGSVTPAQNRKFNWSAPYPDGSFALASSRMAREAYLETDAQLFARTDGSAIPGTTGLTGVVTSAVTPTFSPDGRKVAFNFWEGTGAGGVTAGAGRSLTVMDFACGAAAGSTTCAAGGPRAFSGLREIYKDPARYPSWPSFLPDGKAVVFNNQVQAGDCGPGSPGARALDRSSVNNCQITTWYGAKAELWIAKDGATAQARGLDAANGVGFAPTSVDHPNDAQVNYQPTVNPVPSGGYYWVVFTSRRMYGNLLRDKPWGPTGEGGGPQKKLWVAAIDINAPAGGADPSHPAFYLPGQELSSGNTRGFWAVDPCKANGTSCETGDECCNGFCRQNGDGGALVCGDKPPGTTCVQELEKCTVDADCCDPKQKCIAGRCAQESPVVR